MMEHMKRNFLNVSDLWILACKLIEDCSDENENKCGIPLKCVSTATSLWRDKISYFSSWNTWFSFS